MKNEVKWKGYTIVRWIAVIDMNNGDIIDEVDSVAEYRKAYGKSNTSFVYAAAEVINKDGDVNPAVYGATLKEATDKLKNVLNGKD